MKFFIPHAEDDQQAARVYDSIRKFAVQTTGNGVSDRRIYYIRFTHEGKTYEATVGKPDDRLGEEVIAILEGEATYLVCTPNRGVLRGLPLLVGKHEPLAVEDFEHQ